MSFTSFGPLKARTSEWKEARKRKRRDREIDKETKWARFRDKTAKSLTRPINKGGSIVIDDIHFQFIGLGKRKTREFDRKTTNWWKQKLSYATTQAKLCTLVCLWVSLTKEPQNHIIGKQRANVCILIAKADSVLYWNFSKCISSHVLRCNSHNFRKGFAFN